MILKVRFFHTIEKFRHNRHKDVYYAVIPHLFNDNFGLTDGNSLNQAIFMAHDYIALNCMMGAECQFEGNLQDVLSQMADIGLKRESYIGTLDIDVDWTYLADIHYPKDQYSFYGMAGRLVCPIWVRKGDAMPDKKHAPTRIRGLERAFCLLPPPKLIIEKD